MGVDKIILKTFLTTLASIFALIIFMIIGLCAVFPSTSMQIAYDMGMEASSIHFAERAYKDSHDIYFIAYATEVAIEEDKSGKIISCGEKFIADEGFETYCELKGESYEQFIYGQVCVSKYKKGSKEEAVTLAYESLQGAFPEGNALVAVLLTALRANDSSTVDMIKIKLNEISASGEDGEYFQQMLALIK